jgi:hypothetical protein
MRLTRSRAFTAAAVSAAVAAGGLVALTGAEAAAAGCRVTYTIGSQWPSGFTGNVSITNLGDPLTSWTLTWSFTAGQQVTQGWNGTFTQSGAQVSVANAGWNGALGTGASTGLGFNASWNNSANPVPASFALNGTTCGGTVSPGPGTVSPITPSNSPSSR